MPQVVAWVHSLEQNTTYGGREVEGLTLKCVISFVYLSPWMVKPHSCFPQRQLQHVALLKQEPGAAFSLSDSSSMFYSPGNRFCTEDMCFNITVSFTCSHPGLYVQWLVLDFDMRPVLVRKLKVRVGLLSFDDDDPPSWNPGAMFQRTERWNRDNRVIIPCSSRTEEQEKLSKEYKLPQMNSFRKYSQTKQPLLNDKNYREWMHQFLYAEEQARSQIVSR